MPIAWVHTAGGPPISYALENSRAKVVQAAAGKLRRYNTGEIERRGFDSAVQDTARRA